jgi:hypothetical protein
VEIKPVIFVFSAVLLVPFVYALSYTPEVCALDADPHWGKTGECQDISVGDGKVVKECCWEEPDVLNPGKTIKWCQRCATEGAEGGKDCGPVYVKPTGKDLVVPPSGGILQDPSTDSGPKRLKGDFLKIYKIK